MARATGLEPAASGVIGRTSASKIKEAGDISERQRVAESVEVARLDCRGAENRRGQAVASALAHPVHPPASTSPQTRRNAGDWPDSAGCYARGSPALDSGFYLIEHRPAVW